ncbi:MAG TPA: Shedu immune nuclease family protein [Allosphingosinicella sp.]|jgi:hypothetical protein
MKRRRDAWREPRYFTVGSVGEDTDLIPALNEILPGNAEEKFTESSLLKACKEIIVYRQEDGRYGASLISAAICSERRALAYYHFLDAIDMDEDELIKTLALCEVYEVPVFPDTLDLVPQLESLFARLYESGFKMPGAEGEPVRLKLVKSVGGSPLMDLKVQLDDPLPRFVQPALALSAQMRLQRVRELFDHTAAFLEHFGKGIAALETALGLADASERDLQVVLETYPELFGLTYSSVRSQFAFAERFVADFAFFTGQGSTIFVEIEAPNRRLFTKKGDQTADLTHAIGQVTAWHRWLAQNALYIRDKIPNVEAPYSWIIIGRSDDLDEESMKRLSWINSVNRNQYRIMTYDDLLAEARHLLSKLTGGKRTTGFLLP